MTNLNTGMYSLKVKGTTEQNNSTVITKQIYVDEDLTWTAFVKEKPINLEWIETQPILNTVEILLNTLQIIDDLKTCKGILIETYQDVLGGNVNNKYLIKNEEVLGIVEGNVMKNCSFLA